MPRLFGLIILIASGAVAAVYTLDDASHATIRIELAKAMLQLVTVGIIAVGAKHVLEQGVENRRKADAAKQARIAALAELTRAYWGIKKALFIISANRSARSYTDQVQLIIDHRLALQQLWNEIESGSKSLPKEIGKHFHPMDAALDAVIEEWKARNLELSRQQQEDEKNPTDRKVPAMIEALPTA